MKVSLRQSGGYAGPSLVRECALDAAQLSDADGKRLRALVADSGLLTSPGNTLTSTEGADMQTYDIAIEAGGGTVHHRFDDMTIPEPVYPLIDFLLERCDL